MKMISDTDKKPYKAMEKAKMVKKTMSDFKPNGGMKGKGKSFKGKPANAGAFKYHEGK